MKRKGKTSYKETALGIIPRKELIPLEIKGIKLAWDFVLSKKEKGTIPLSGKFIRKVHEIGFAWIFPEDGEVYRKIDVKVSSHVPPKFYLVNQFMVDFFLDVKTRIKHLPDINDEDYLKELTELLSWIHHRFLWIHPFKDYNGRIARLLTNIILLNLDLPPIELKVETRIGRRKYIEALEKADKGNYEKLEKLINSALKEAAKYYDSEL